MGGKTETVIVFVYGTLKRGLRNFYFFQNMKATFLKTDTIKDATIFVGEWSRIPFITDAKGKEVKGELFQVDAKYLGMLDGFERAYTRREVTTASGVKAFAYFAPEGVTPYSDGDAIEIGSEYLKQHYERQPQRQVKEKATHG